MAIIIHPDGTQTVVTPAKKKFTLDELQKHVGGPIEPIPFKVRRAIMAAKVPANAQGKMPCTAWCNEEGKLHPPVRENPVATSLFECGYDCLVGDILLCYAGES